MPYMKALKKLDITRRITAEIPTAELNRLLAETRPEPPTIRAMPAVFFPRVGVSK